MENNNQNIDPDEQLRLGMHQWASGVGVAATEYEGQKFGLTVSSFTSISVEPPVVLISVNKTSQAHEPILKSGKFGVTLLAEDQQRISDRFAGRVDQDRGRFEGLDTFTLQTGSPFITGGVSVFDCEVMDTYDTGTTTVIYGKVVAAQLMELPEDGKRPLLYYYQGYRKLAEGS